MNQLEQKLTLSIADKHVGLVNYLRKLGINTPTELLLNNEEVDYLNYIFDLQRRQSIPSCTSAETNNNDNTYPFNPSILRNVDPRQRDISRLNLPQYLQDLVRLFMHRFYGNPNVYALLSIKQKGDHSFKAYYPQCHNLFNQFCPKKQQIKTKCENCAYRSFKPLRPADFLFHLCGPSLDGSFNVIGSYPIIDYKYCKYLAIDFDNHGGNEEDNATWQAEVTTLRNLCYKHNIPHLVERSRSGNGAHMWFFFEHLVEAKQARRFAHLLILKASEGINRGALSSYDRLFPTSDSLNEGQIGNLIALPLQYRALCKGNSAFVDDYFKPLANQFMALRDVGTLTADNLAYFISTWQESEQIFKSIIASNDINNADANLHALECDFDHEELNAELHIIIADSIYIDCSQLKGSFIAKLRAMATFENKYYFVQQKNNSKQRNRFFYCAEFKDNVLVLPRGLIDRLTKKLDAANINYSLEDHTVQSGALQTKLLATLKTKQQEALDKLCATTQGIMLASTGFGKSFMVAAIIARIQKPCLVIVFSDLIKKQIIDGLQQNLSFDMPLPSYTTPSGMVKKFNSHIGGLKTTYFTRIVDVVTAQFLTKKSSQELKSFLEHYPLIVTDECHHYGDNTYSHIISSAKAKFIYGMTATLERSDGCAPLIPLLIGDIRFVYDNKDKANEDGLIRSVRRRYTNFTMLEQNLDRISLENILAQNTYRNKLIANDCRSLLQEGRNILILVNRIEQASLIYDMLNDLESRCIPFYQDMLVSSLNAQLNTLMQQGHNFAIIATVKKAGEGFDCPALDTLLLTFPTSSSAVLTQAVGRIERSFKEKNEYLVYDYIDHFIPNLLHKFNKRCKIYKKLSYVIDGLSSASQVIDHQYKAAYKGDDYFYSLSIDLQSAAKSIVIAVREISFKQTYRLLSAMESAISNGAHVYILLLSNGNDYNFRISKRLKKLGLDIKLYSYLADELIIIDRHIIWFNKPYFLKIYSGDESCNRIDNTDFAAQIFSDFMANSHELN